MLLTRAAERVNFFLRRRFGEESLNVAHGTFQKAMELVGQTRGLGQGKTHLDKVDALWLHSPDRLRAAMKERLGHRRFIRTLDPACSPVGRYTLLRLGPHEPYSPKYAA